MNQRGNDFIVSLRRHLVNTTGSCLAGFKARCCRLSAISDVMFFFQDTPRQAVVIRGGCMPDQGRGDVFVAS